MTLDDLADGLPVLVGELGIMPDPRIVDQQVDPSRQLDGAAPELLAKPGVSQVAGQHLHLPGRQLGRQFLQPVQPPRRRQHRHPAILHELPDHLPSQPRRGARHQGVCHGFHGGITTPPTILTPSAILSQPTDSGPRPSLSICSQLSAAKLGSIVVPPILDDCS